MSIQSSHYAAIPSHRASRMMHLGGLAIGIAGGVLAEGARRAWRGELSDPRSLLLTTENAARLADKLSHLRGAAMKVGQLISMEAGELLPAEFISVLTRLREEAHYMPLGQVADQLDAAWGHGWEQRFHRFSFTPLAAASIGQVHVALLKDGRRLAIKLQYPGVRRSIDSDVDNVAGILRLLAIVPSGADLSALYAQAKQQLHEEADYRKEAEHLRKFGDYLKQDADFLLPEVVDEFSNENVLTMSFVPGSPVDALATAAPELRDRVASLLIHLLFRKFFEFRAVQTDPNFANYRDDTDSNRIILLDFGATRHYAPERMAHLRDLMTAAYHQDHASIVKAALALGYLEESDSSGRREALIELFLLVCEPARHVGAYDFRNSGLSMRLRNSSYAIGFDRGQWRPPPADLIFLHRKLAGLYLLSARLQARVNVGALLLPHLH